MASKEYHEELFINYLREATLNPSALRSVPDVSHKLREIKRKGEVKFFRDEQDVKVKGTDDAVEAAQRFLKVDIVTTPRGEDTEHLQDLLSGRRLGKLGKVLKSKDVKSNLPFAAYCAFMLQNKKAVQDQIKKLNCEFVIGQFNKEFVDVIVSGDEKDVDKLSEYLQKKVQLHEKNLDVHTQKAIVSDPSQFLHEVKQFNPDLAILQGSYIHLVFTKGKIPSEIKEMVSDKADLFPPKTLDIEGVLSEITSERNPNHSSIYTSYGTSNIQSHGDIARSSQSTNQTPGGMSANELSSSQARQVLTEKSATRGSWQLSHQMTTPSQQNSSWEHTPHQHHTAVSHRRAPPSQAMSQYEHPGTRIRITCIIADITLLEVDCIVNAANRDLEHIGGVAYAIAKAAGRELDKECHKYVKKRGPLNVADVFVSTAGQLKCKRVLHTVGPMWRHHADHDECVDQLQTVFTNCLNKAEDLKLSSIAFPAISSGIYGVPLHHVSHAACDAIQMFCACHSDARPRLREVFFADIAQDTFDSFSSVFDLQVAQGIFKKATTV